MSDQFGYVDGLSHGLDIAVRLSSWIRDNCVEGFNCWLYEDTAFDDNEILDIYLQHITSPK